MTGERNFPMRCPKCGHTTFDEVQTSVTTVSEFSSITVFASPGTPLELNYTGDTEETSGNVTQFRCSRCQHEIAKSYAELRAWVEQQFATQAQVVEYDWPGLLGELTATKPSLWLPVDGPDSRCGTDYWYRHAAYGEANINNDQGHVTVNVTGVGNIYDDVLEEDERYRKFIKREKE